jgi:hypothetical protein
VFLYKAKLPVAVLLPPVVLKYNAARPLAVFVVPVVLLYNATEPTDVLLSPVVLEIKELLPTEVFASPPVLFCKEPTPTEVFDPPMVFEDKELKPMLVFAVPVVLAAKAEVPNLVLFVRFPPPLPMLTKLKDASLEKVFAPAIVCVPVVTNPLAVAEALGILNVCVDPALLILKSVPVVPVAKFCTCAVNPFKAVKPVVNVVMIWQRLLFSVCMVIVLPA